MTTHQLERLGLSPAWVFSKRLPSEGATRICAESAGLGGNRRRDAAPPSPGPVGPGVAAAGARPPSRVLGSVLGAAGIKASPSGCYIGKLMLT